VLFTDYILNGQGFGEVGSQLAESRFDPGYMRPFRGDDGGCYITVNAGKRFDEKTQKLVPQYKTVRTTDMMQQGMFSPVWNAGTSLRKDEWIQLDQIVIQAARQRLRAWSDLAAANTYGGFNGMNKMLLEHETMSDPGSAVVDMDGLSEARNDSPKFQLEGLPLPITHAGFFFSGRRLAISRNTGTPLDLVMAEAAGRRIAETIEQTTIGTVTGVTYGTASDYGRAPTVYGFTNFPDRVTKTNMTSPTGSNGSSVLGSWLALRDLMYSANFYGPFMVYVSNDWDQYLDNLFSTTEPSAGTLRKRLLEIDNITDIRRLDYLPGPFQVLFVQMTPDVARAVIGMDMTTVQWESQGGSRLNFRVMSIMVPQLRADFNGNCGIGHGTIA